MPIGLLKLTGFTYGVMLSCAGHEPCLDTLFGGCDYLVAHVGICDEADVIYRRNGLADSSVSISMCSLCAIATTPKN
jgi:hypothetical protein